MRLVRLATCAALAGSLLVVGTSQAKVAPVCNLVTDASGDAVLAPIPEPSVDPLDIVSADVATDKANITGVIRVKKLATMSAQAPTGMTWDLGFTVDGVQVDLIAHAGPSGATSFDASYVDPTTGQGSYFAKAATGSFDLTKSEIHITASTDVVGTKAPMSKKTILTDFAVSAGPEVAVPDVNGTFGSTAFSDGVSQDTATGSGKYLVGAPSCVVPGK